MTLSHLPGPVFNPAPGHAQLHAINILRLDNFLPPRQLIPRHCASAISKLCLPGLYLVRLSILYRDRTCTQYKLYHDGKKYAIPVLHRDSYPAKVPGHYLDAASDNIPPLQAGSSLSRHNMSGLNARPSLLPGRYV
jgi:hypothetical protein